MHKRAWLYPPAAGIQPPWLPLHWPARCVVLRLVGERRTLVGIAGVDMLSWGGANPQDTLQGLLQVVSRLLQPDMGDSSSLYVGGLIHQLLLKMPAQVWLATLDWTRHNHVSSGWAPEDITPAGHPDNSSLHELCLNGDSCYEVTAVHVQICQAGSGPAGSHQHQVADSALAAASGYFTMHICSLGPAGPCAP